VGSARLRQVLLILTFLPWCWLMMMAVHEAGHVLAAWLTGASIERVVLPPLGFSQTVLGGNPQPLPVAWAGALVGCGLPLLAWVITRPFSARVTVCARFLAGFCLMANGAYLGIGAWSGDGDAGDLVAAGAAVWQLVAFGVLACAAGLWLWHGLAPAMGWRRGHEVGWRGVWMTALLLSATVVIELLLA
jgi:hypothetical protein